MLKNITFVNLIESFDDPGFSLIKYLEIKSIIIECKQISIARANLFNTLLKGKKLAQTKLKYHWVIKKSTLQFPFEKNTRMLFFLRLLGNNIV